jgi:hypothetical protein
MKTRMMLSKPTMVPKSPAEWDLLASRANKAADLIGDKRAYSIMKAIQEGKAEKVLRSYGIISEVDVNREFPVPG